MLKIYRMPNGRTFQFDEKDVPAGAVPVEQETKENKVVKPKNKVVKPKNKVVRK